MGMLCCGALFLLSAGLFMFLPSAFSDGDTWWHLTSGRYIVEHRMVPTADPFSYTFPGQPWVAHEWLAEVFMFGSYSLFGWAGVALLYGVCFGSIAALIAAHAQRWMPPIPASALALLAVYCLIPRIIARPHIAALLILTLWLLALMRARERHEAPRAVWGLLMLVWANLHASYAFGLFVAGAFGLEAVLAAPKSERWPAIRSWATFGAVILVASMITPSGPKGLLFPFMVSGMEALSGIGEWRPSNFSEPSYFSISLYFLLFFCLFRPVRVPPVRLALVILTLHMALSHVRHQEIFALVSSLLLARPLGSAYFPERGDPGTFCTLKAKDLSHSSRRTAGAIALAVLILICVRLTVPLTRAENGASPLKALASVPAGLRQHRVFNGYGMGGLLIHEGIPVFIDGRIDMYGERFAQDFIDIEVHGNIDKWKTADRQWHFCWTILSPRTEVAKWLDSQKNWSRLHADQFAVVHRRLNDRSCD